MVERFDVQRFLELLAQASGLPIEGLDPSLTFEELGLDSLVSFELLHAVEE